MDEINKPTDEGSVSSTLKNNAEIALGETKYKVFRLKAGRFYEALKIYMELIRETASSTSSSGQGEAESKANFDKLIVSMFQTWPEKMVEFIAICCSTAKNVTDNGKVEMTKDKVKEDAYPEQITEAFRVCMKLNRFAENIKNFGAPIKELGAEVQAGFQEQVTSK